MKYFEWYKKEKKPFYTHEEVRMSLKKRREKRFQNLLLDVYYWFRRNFEWVWTPSILKGKIERFWQRRTRGWDYSDCWSLDYTIAKFTLPRLIELKKMMHGIPTSMFEELPENEWNYSEEQSEIAEKKWNHIIDEMIFAMDYIANEREWDYYPKKDGETTREDYAELRAVEERVQNGLELFGKHFRSLWD